MGDARLRIAANETLPARSSFIIDLLNEIAGGKEGAALGWLRRNGTAALWISPVTLAEVLEAPMTGRRQGLPTALLVAGNSSCSRDLVATAQRAPRVAWGE